MSSCYRLDSSLYLTSIVAAGFGRHGMPPTASNPDLWPFDLETSMRVASKAGNLPSKFGRVLGSRIIRYVRDGRTDRRTDKSNAYCRLPYGRGHTNECSEWSIVRDLICLTIFYFVSGKTINFWKETVKVRFGVNYWSMRQMSTSIYIASVIDQVNGAQIQWFVDKLTDSLDASVNIIVVTHVC